MKEIELPEGMSKQELLKLLQGQCRSAIGFEQDQELNEDRARALDYYKGLHEGYVAKDLPVEGEGRSTSVTTEVADAVETAMPDIMEVLTNGDDVITFRPVGEDDEEQAKQETDMVRHVFFNENNGWDLLYTAIKDALLSKTGIFKYYWDATPEYEEYDEEVDEDGIQQLEAMGIEIVEISEEADENGLFKVTGRKLLRDGRLVVENVAPEDFAVASSTVKLRTSDYVSERTRPTIQDLRARDYDEDDILTLVEADEDDDDVTQARDAAYEHQDEEDGGSESFKEVEVYEHYIRLDANEDGELQLYRIVTDSHQKAILEMEKRAQIEYAAICPYPMPHRFYGQSVADKTVPIQKWKTSITRLTNDGFAHSLYARPEVAADQIVPGKTVTQLSNNGAGIPFVTKNGNGVKMHESPGNPGAMLSYLEYINTVSEQRTGIVRNAQGLNPDTLHDTKGGAEILIGAAQKRIRLMVRQFAEGGLRDLFMGIHELLRSNATMMQTVRLRGKWVQVDPSNWRRRNDMDVHIGVGSGGREQELIAMREYFGLLEKVVTAQGGMNGPIVTMKQLYNFTDYAGDRLGLRGTDRFAMDPEAPENQPEQPEQPQMDPAVQQAMMEFQKDQAQFMAKMEADERKAFMAEQTKRMKIELEAHLKTRQQDMEASLERERGPNNITDVRFGGVTG